MLKKDFGIMLPTKFYISVVAIPKEGFTGRPSQSFWYEPNSTRKSTKAAVYKSKFGRTTTNIFGPAGADLGGGTRGPWPPPSDQGAPLKAP